LRQPSTVFGSTLRALRTARGVSQETFAFECGLNRQFISILELGDQSPSLDTVFKLAAGLDMTAAALVADIEARMQAAAVRKKRSASRSARTTPRR
jgi:transcriptional regulator with XRE-family HTH domain